MAFIIARQTKRQGTVINDPTEQRRYGTLELGRILRAKAINVSDQGNTKATEKLYADAVAESLIKLIQSTVDTGGVDEFELFLVNEDGEYLVRKAPNHKVEVKRNNNDTKWRVIAKLDNGTNAKMPIRMDGDDGQKKFKMRVVFPPPSSGNFEYIGDAAKDVLDIGDQGEGWEYLTAFKLLGRCK